MIVRKLRSGPRGPLASDPPFLPIDLHRYIIEDERSLQYDLSHIAPLLRKAQRLSISRQRVRLRADIRTAVVRGYY